MEKANILIVDDLPANRALLIAYLQLIDVNVDEAESGDECLRKLLEKSYTLICLDVLMPEMDGYQVLEKIRYAPATMDIPVILISATLNTDEYVLKGLSVGATDFLSKPINPQIFISKVNNFIQAYEKQRKLDLLIKKLESVNNRLRENEQKFKRITQSASDAIIVLDSKFQIRFCNKAGLEIFAYNIYEILSESIFDCLISLKSKQILLEHIQTLTSSGVKLTNSIRLTGRNKYGIEFPVELSLAVYKTSQDETNYTAIIRDITNQVKNEKEALAAKELRDANKVMKEFMDNVSHELRTPMNAIIGISNMFLKYSSHNLTEEQIEGLQLINQSGSRLLELINDILDLSRLESNKQKVKVEKFSLDEFLANMRSMVITLIHEKPIKFIIRKSPAVPERIATDSKILSQILTNLLSNAVKFTNEGSIRLNIHCSSENKLFFEVTDTGIGISEDNLKIIFRRFEQIDNSASKQFKGTGLGLNITKKLIELMNGDIQVESQLNKGTSMKFFIPVKFEEKIEPIIKDSITIDENLSNKYRLKLAVIIDYREETHFLLKKILEEENFMTYSCHSSSSGLKAIYRFHPDLVILKMEMPKIHGQLILREFEESKELSSIPVIILTSISDYVQKQKINLLSILTEPINHKELVESIREISKLTKNRFESNILILSEKKEETPALFKEYEFFYNDNVDTFKLTIAQRLITLLIIDGIDAGTNNFKIVEWLATNEEFQPKEIFIASDQISEQVENLVKKLPNVKIIQSSELNPSELL